MFPDDNPWSYQRFIRTHAEASLSLHAYCPQVASTSYAGAASGALGAHRSGSQMEERRQVWGLWFMV